MDEKLGGVRPCVLLAFLLLASVFAVGDTTKSQEEVRPSVRWEYLVVSGASSTNLTPSGNSRMRKEATGAFGREAFVLEQHLDKLGAQGWELVSVTESRSDPVYYLKRRR
jgi:hypothetical protein